MANIFYNKDDEGNYTELGTIYATLGGTAFADISALNFSNLDNTGSVGYCFNNAGSFVTGTNNLLQRIIKSILTIQGSNAYEPKFGSHFYGIYQSISLDEIEDLKAKFPLFLKTLTDTLIEEDLMAMANGYTINPAERLQNLILEDIVYDDTFSG